MTDVRSLADKYIARDGGPGTAKPVKERTFDAEMAIDVLRRVIQRGAVTPENRDFLLRQINILAQEVAPRKALRG